MAAASSSKPASNSEAPPVALDWARVIAYAIVDSDVTWTGRQIHYVGDEKLGPVPRLAICQNLFADTDDVLLFFCDDEWNVLGATGRPTIEENLEAAERWYSGISSKWIHTGISREDAERLIREECADSACSFCNRMPPEVDCMVGSNAEKTSASANICNYCVDEIYAAMHSKEMTSTGAADS